MERIIKYIASDGKEFSDADECMNYEINLFKPNEDELVLLDVSANVLPISFQNVCDCEYMSIKSHKALKYVEMIGEEYGYAVPDKCGNFFCDNTSPSWWSDVKKIFDDALKIAKAFGVELIKEGN